MMLFNFVVVVVAVYIAIYLGAYFFGFKYIGLVTREHDGRYELLEFYYNGFTDSYYTNQVCILSEKTYKFWNTEQNIKELPILLDELRRKYN